MIVTTPRRPDDGSRAAGERHDGDQAEAEAALTRLLGEVSAGRHTGPDVTIAELLAQWYAIASPDWSPKTVLETRRYIDNYLVPHLGKVKVRKLTTAQLDGYYYAAPRARWAHGRAPAPSRRCAASTSSSAAPSPRPSVGVGSPRTQPPTQRRGGCRGGRSSPPDPEATVRLIEAAEAEEAEFGVFLRLAASTGARRGELCALRWSDIDLAAGTVTIGRSLVDSADGGYVEKDAKRTRHDASLWTPRWSRR